MSNVYLCIQDYQLIKDLIDYDTIQNDINIVGISTTVQEDIHQLINMKVDVFVLQFSSDYQQCSNLIALINESELLHDMQILLIFKELNIDTIHLLGEYNIKSFIMEPFTSKQLVNAILEKGNNKEISDVSKWNLESIATKTMHELGLPIHLDGFLYIKTCALLVNQYYLDKRLIIGNIYQECAKMYETTASRVEKSIRTAINYAYRSQPENICIYNEKPTNSQIILYISEKLKLYSVI